MKPLTLARENWRVTMLVVLVALLLVSSVGLTVVVVMF